MSSIKCRSATIVQKVRNQKDKAFGVNVICGGDLFGMCTAAYNVVVIPLGICPENKKDSNKSEGSSYNI